ncbi:conserved protein of unknown function [Tenacibaculum sp. 190524A02b]|uniref:hypothetical protein n=1 Tax=Tenacibaculum vairaonense TaxID=3137860 RepID=UPI0032B20542
MKKDKTTIKTYFETGDKPTQEQYINLIDSYVDARQPEGEPNRRFVIDEKGEVTVASEQKAPEYTLIEIAGNKLALLKDKTIVKEIDLAPYVDDTNLARLVSGTVDENGLATFTRDDDSTFTVDFSSFLNQPTTQPDWQQIDATKPDFIKNKPDFLPTTGGNISNSVIIDTEKSTTPIAQSVLTVKENSPKKGSRAAVFVDANNENSEASETDDVYGAVFRNTFNGTHKIEQIAGILSIGRNVSSSEIDWVTGTRATGQHNGTGNIFSTSGDMVVAEVNGSGNSEHVFGSFVTARVNNKDTVVDYLESNKATIDLKQGTVKNAYLQYLDLDFDAANAANVNLENLYYLYAKNDNRPEVSGEAYFVKSLVDLPSLFSGTVEMNVSNEIINKAGNKTLITKEFADTKYSRAFKVINTTTPQTSEILNTSFPLESNPIGTQVMNQNVTERYIYTRITDTAWRRGELLTDI